MNNLCNISLSADIRKGVLRRYMEPILLHQSQSWTNSKLEEKMFGLLCFTEWWEYNGHKKSHKDVLRETISQMELVSHIGRRQSIFFGNVTRTWNWNMLSMQKFEVRKGSGKWRETMLKGVASRHRGMSVAEIIGCAWIEGCGQTW